jgi:hypothetical protein
MGIENRMNLLGSIKPVWAIFKVFFPGDGWVPHRIAGMTSFVVASETLDYLHTIACYGSSRD